MATPEELREPLLADADEEEAVVRTASTGSLLSVPCASTPPRDTTKPLLTVCPPILSAEFCERLAYYGLATNLVSFFTERMAFSKADAASAVQSWSGACYATALVGAVVADSALGRCVPVSHDLSPRLPLADICSHARAATAPSCCSAASTCWVW